LGFPRRGVGKLLPLFKALGRGIPTVLGLTWGRGFQGWQLNSQIILLIPIVPIRRKIPGKLGPGFWRGFSRNFYIYRWVNSFPQILSKPPKALPF